jgi:CheY-like chemotaxis protein
MKVGLVTALHPSASGEDIPMEAASALAVSSIESILKSLSIQSTRCKWQSQISHNLMIVMEADVNDCLATLRKNATTDNGAVKNKEGFAPVLVVCNNSPSAQLLRDRWAMDELQSYVTMEHIALPCGIKQMSRTLSSIQRLHKKRTMTVLEMSKAHEELGNGRPANGDAKHDARIYRQLPIRSLAPLSAATKIPTLVQFEAASVESSAADTHALPVQPLPAEVQPLHSPSRHILDPQALSYTPSVRTLMPVSSSIEVPVAPVVGPIANIPTLLLVDDNNVNLRLLAAFAKKHKYPHLTAQDGQLAVDAFVNAHRSLALQQGTGTHAIDAGATGIPNVILMDINMPVMDGYEAVQRIRSYENKHHMAASKIIAVTALQSEAARAEAYGSGFNMFLSKPIKLQDLAKLIFLVRE